HLGGVRYARTLCDAGSLLDQLGGRRGLGDERERAVFVDRDLHGNHIASLRLGRGVVGLAELHDVHTVLTQRGSHGWCGVRGASLDLKFDQTSNLLLRGCHVWVLLLLEATGVAM